MTTEKEMRAKICPLLSQAADPRLKSEKKCMGSDCAWWQSWEVEMTFAKEGPISRGLINKGWTIGAPSDQPGYLVLHSPPSGRCGMIPPLWATEMTISGDPGLTLSADHPE